MSYSHGQDQAVVTTINSILATTQTPDEKRNALQLLLQRYPGNSREIIPAMQEVAAGAAYNPTPVTAMAQGGIIAFKDGGKVQGYAEGHKVKGGKEVAPNDPYWPAAEAAPTLGTGLYDMANAPGNAGAPLWAQPSPEDVAKMIGSQPKALIPGLAVSHYGSDVPDALVDTPSPTIATTFQDIPSSPFTAADKAWLVKNAGMPDIRPKTAPDAGPAGITSLGGSVGTAGSRSAAADYSGYMAPELSLDQAYAAQQALEGPDDSMPTYKAERAKQRADIESQRRSLQNEALMRAGASMMSSRSPYFLSSVGEGITGGLEGYTKGRGEINAAERAGTKEDLMAGNIARQEKIGGIRAAQSAVTANQTQRLGVLKDMTMQDRYLAQLNAQADKAASVGDNQARVAIVRELGDLHKAALSTTAQALVLVRLADPAKGGSPEDYLAAKQAYAVAQRNETNMANAVIQHAGGRGIQSLQALSAVNPADPNNFYTATPQGKVRAPLSVGR